MRSLKVKVPQRSRSPEGHRSMSPKGQGPLKVEVSRRSQVNVTQGSRGHYELVSWRAESTASSRFLESMARACADFNMDFLGNRHG